jgi:hypothetical protein
LAPCQSWPVVGPFEFWLLVNPGPLSAHFEVWLIVSPGLLLAPFEVWLIVSLGPLSAHYGVWPIVGPFESTSTSHLPPLLAGRQPLSSSATSTIYGPFPASATTIIIVSNFKLKVAEYSTLSLRGDVRIFYILFSRFIVFPIRVYFLP